MAVVYLSSLSNLMAIIMRYVAMASIVKYDDMYAASLFESKVKKAKGKKLQNYFKRGDEGNHVDKSCTMKLLRFVYKIYRVLYIVYNYYFAPFLAVLITFFVTAK